MTEFPDLSNRSLAGSVILTDFASGVGAGVRIGVVVGIGVGIGVYGDDDVGIDVGVRLEANSSFSATKAYVILLSGREQRF